MRKVMMFLLFVGITAVKTVIVGQINGISPDVSRINAVDMMKTIDFLASDITEGRLPSSDGYYKAASYMSDRFRELELIPLGEEDYFQYVNVEYCEIFGQPVFKQIFRNDSVKEYLLGSDFVFRGSTGFNNITSYLVFCGYGLSAPDSGYDDYDSVDVKGKVVIVFKQNPQWTITDFSTAQKYNYYKSNVAAEHGAIGIILVSTPLLENPQKPIGSIMNGVGYYDDDFPQLHIDIAVADELLEDSGMQLAEVQKIIDSTRQPFSFPLNKKVVIDVEGEYAPSKQSYNVVGMLRGCDSALADEYIVISAHLDHVGKQGNMIFYGANDNASGSAAVLELAHAFTSQKVKPGRSIIFVLYTSEEQGMYGAYHFADNCPVPLDKIVAAFNMDCIAYGDSIQVGNGNSNPVLWNLAESIDYSASKLMIKSTWSGGGADLHAMYQKGVPGLYFVTKNSYEHLHLPSDKLETLNKDLYEKMVRLVYSVAWEVSMGNYEREKLIK